MLRAGWSFCCLMPKVAKRPGSPAKVGVLLLAPPRSRSLGNHHKQIQLLLILSAASPVVLGSPWLATHNPNTVWTLGTLWATVSVAYHSHCLRSALPPMPLDLTSLSQTVDLSPHDLGEVFWRS